MEAGGRGSTAPWGFLHRWPLGPLTEAATRAMAGGLITVAMNLSS